MKSYSKINDPITLLKTLGIDRKINIPISSSFKDVYKIKDNIVIYTKNVDMFYNELVYLKKLENIGCPVIQYDILYKSEIELIALTDELYHINKLTKPILEEIEKYTRLIADNYSYVLDLQVMLNKDNKPIFLDPLRIEKEYKHKTLDLAARTKDNRDYYCFGISERGEITIIETLDGELIP